MCKMRNSFYGFQGRCDASNPSKVNADEREEAKQLCRQYANIYRASGNSMQEKRTPL